MAVCLMAALAVQAGAATEYPADIPYDSYVYDVDGNALAVPAPYEVQRTITGGDLGLDSFQDLSDVFFDGERLYLCDGGNNRVVITDAAFQPIDVLDAFENAGEPDTLKGPRGVYVSGGTIYVADTGSGRLVLFDRKTLDCQRVLDRPQVPQLEEDYTYSPLKVAVDDAGRIYVIADGVNQGLMELDENGQFSTFLGAPEVKPDLLDLIWRKFMTKEQIDQMEKNIPTEYNAMLLDQDGFIYAVAKSSEISPVAKLNSQGSDVLQFRDDYGDEAYQTEDGEEIRPYFADITVDDEGFVTLLDSKQGKLYVYTPEGELLFAFGANGSQKGTFYSAGAIEQVGETLLVADGSKNTVTVYRPTAFGANVTAAVRAHAAGRNEEARSLWQTVRQGCSHYPMALVGLAQADIQDGRYTDAMARLEPLHETRNYNIAFTKWRDGIIRGGLGWMLLILAAVIAVLALVPRLVRRTQLGRRLAGSPLNQQYRYGTYAMFHPFDGFWDIKREHRGGIGGACLTLGLFILLYAIRAQFSGFIVTGTVSSEVNVLYECLMILLPLAFWVIANWCFTTLMDGEGSMKDIFIATSYALKPYVIFSIPLFFLSHVLTAEEAIFYVVGDRIAILWVLLLLFFGMMMTHDYSLSKAVLALLCTLVGICLILFICLLFLNVVQDVVRFFMDIYREIAFRTY